ncbi:MAG: hypothetical protein KIS73_13635 [Enhydrobacter sp.]|nr:hypothetical protein [Enhydrobacter sp.]
MDIDQLRGWAAFMDRAMIVSLAAVVSAVSALAITTFLSSRFGEAVRSHEQAALERHTAMESDAAPGAQEVAAAKVRLAGLEQEVSLARERAATLEQQVSTQQGQAQALEHDVSAARERAAALEQEVSVARERAVALEREASVARERAVAFEQAAREANERLAKAARESAPVAEKPRAPQVDAAEIQQRLADLGKLVRAAAGRAADTPPPSAQDAPSSEPVPDASGNGAAPRETPPPPIVLSLRKYAGTKAAVFVVQPISDAQAVGSAISAYLGEAGWAPGIWTWTGVAGIFGVVVLVRDGSDPATHEAASVLVEALRSAGFNASKGDWPANWSRFRGMLDGPQTPGPTDASIRIVIGAKPR